MSVRGPVCLPAAHNCECYVRNWTQCPMSLLPWLRTLVKAMATVMAWCRLNSLPEQGLTQHLANKRSRHHDHAIQCFGP